MAEGDDLPCQAFVELVTEYLEGALPATERERVEAHLADCDYCGDYLDQIRLTIRALGQLSDERLSPAARRNALLAAATALTLLLSIVFDLTAFATAVYPALWIAFLGPSRCGAAA